MKFRWVSSAFFQLFSDYFLVSGNPSGEFLPDACTFAISPDPDAFFQLIRHSQPVRSAAVNVVLQKLLEKQNWLKQPQKQESGDEGASRGVWRRR